MISYATLDRLLHQIDPEEEGYRNGTLQFNFNEDNSVILNGQRVSVISFAKAIFPFVDSPNPNITIVKTGRFFPVPMHIHPWVEIGYMYSGSCQHTIKDKTYTFTKGQLYILDSDTPHAIGYLGENNIHISIVLEKQYFTDSFFTRFSENSILSKFLINSISKHTSHDNFLLFNSENNRRIHTYIAELLCEHINPSINSVDIINNYIALLFLELVNVYETDQIKPQLNHTQSNILPILKYIETNYKTCDLKSTAAFFSMNPNYLTTFIKKNTGYSFKQLIQHQRFQFINSQLLNTSLPIETIALSAGYENTTYFYKKYKEAFGCSPKEFRDKHNSKAGRNT